MMVFGANANNVYCLSLCDNDDVLEVLTQLFYCGPWMEIQISDV